MIFIVNWLSEKTFLRWACLGVVPRLRDEDGSIKLWKQVF
jgi:hypothetical protein